MFSGTLCQPWSAHRFYWLGGLTQIVPALKMDGNWIANPLVITDRILDEYGRFAIGEFKTEVEREQGKATLASTPRYTLDILPNTGNTCGCLTTWSLRFSNAISR